LREVYRRPGPLLQLPFGHLVALAHMRYASIR
jgi:hypothetical protein